MTKRSHTHPCSECQRPVPCSGEPVDNSDGWPEVICSDYHVSNGTVADVCCEDCYDKAKG